MRPFLVLSIALMAGVPAFAGLQGRPPEPGPSPRPGETLMDETPDGGGIANLPWSRGQRFRTLDDYLAHLERQGAIDLPWWRQVEPGIYELVGMRVPGQSPERATRAELRRRYGFNR